MPREKRLKLLEDNHELIAQRKPLLIREIALLVPLGKYDRAIDLLTNNQFHTSEGGGRELHDTYVDAHLLRGLAYMGEKQYDTALKHFQQASEYPENLAIERPENDRRGPQVAYLTGAAYAGMGQTEQANKFYTQAAGQEIRFGGSESRFYQAMAMKELGQKEKADGIFQDMVASGTRRISGEGDVDFFAKFGERRPGKPSGPSPTTSLVLGLLGQGKPDEARSQFEQALTFNAGHTWAKSYLTSAKGK
jgi:tetratricopeptide (TPR) repeat protein